MSVFRGPGRWPALVRFFFAVAWLAAAYSLAGKAAYGFSQGAAFPLIRYIFEAFLLLLGFSYMELSWNDVHDPLRAMGLGFRSGAAREFALGAAIGWGMVTAVLLVVVLGGHFYVRITGSSSAWAALGLQILVLASGSLAAEIGFRGYPFQQLIHATGPGRATVLAAVFFGLLRIETPGASTTALWVSGVAAVVLSVAYLRTRALWLCWGLHFAWLASIGILFGQPLAGDRQASSVIQTFVDGPTWLTGGEYGPEASLITLIVLLLGLFVLVRATRDLDWKYNQPELHPAGRPVDITNVSRPATITPAPTPPPTPATPPVPDPHND